MSNPSESLILTAEAYLNDSLDQEEEENQKRRNEELQTWITAKFDGVNFDDDLDESSVNLSIVSEVSGNNNQSQYLKANGQQEQLNVLEYESIINSSIDTAILCEDNQNKYLQADGQQEQLKILYEVRLRELQTLKEENKEKTDEMTKEMDAVKKKLMLSEAEVEQLKISYKNSDSLLVEKTFALKELTSVLESKEKQIQDDRKMIDNMQLEISTHKSTINDLHLQIQADRNPFQNTNKQFNSEEYKAAHQEHITRLDFLLEEKTNAVKLMEKENIILKEHQNKLIEENKDHANIIEGLKKIFESAQKQCEELIHVVETVTNENKHLQERVDNIYHNTTGSERNSLDNSNLIHHVDKLKKMLVDKSMEINTLNAKVRNYEENLKELLEYRKLKSDVYQKEYQQCENEDHTKSLLLMQNDLQNYRRVMEDKNQQILNLNNTNKDLLAKMDEKLHQTRNDLNNFSNKYRLPQLGEMAEDLKLAQDRVLYLEQKLKASDDKRLSIVEKESNKEKELQKELETLKLVTDKERNNFENDIKKLKQELDISSTELKNLKQYAEKLVAQNVQLQLHPKAAEEEDNSIKNQYLESIKALHESESKVQLLQETVDEITNLKTIAEGDKCTYEFEAKDCQNKLENYKKYIANHELELEDTLKELQNKEAIIEHLQQTVSSLTDELNVKRDVNVELENTLKELQNKEEMVEYLQEALSRMKEELNMKNSEDDKETNECLKCRAPREGEAVKGEAVRERYEDVKRNWAAELMAIEERELKQTKEADMVSLEVKLREEIQKEYFQKISEIEKKYQKVVSSSQGLCKEQADKLKTQESKFRAHLKMILEECSQKIKEYEHDRQELIKQIGNLQSQFDEYKIRARSKERSFKKTLEETVLNSKRDAEKWKLSSQKLVNKCLKIEATNKKSRDHILFKMQTYDTEVAEIEKAFEKKKKTLERNRK